MHRDPQLSTAEAATPADARALKCFATVAGVMAVVFLVYLETSASMVDTWLRSETYKHCFLVVPAVLWFVWQARHELAATAARPWWPGLALVAGAGLLWLLGDLANALAPTQWAVVAMVPAAVVTLFGWAWMRVLAFPLAFLFFAVPFGEAFTPVLIDWTADFTVAAVSAVGIPVFREGQHFVIPSGRWSVVEACSGIRYLMASVMVGVLYAWSLYRSPVRRAVFIAASFVVPIVANWLRAFMIVMIGHLSGNKLAVGVDHFIYGWVFFGIVIGLLFWVGARWREDDQPTRAIPQGAPAGTTSRIAPALPLLAAVVVLGAFWPAAAAGLLGAVDKRPLQPAAVEPAADWTTLPSPVSAWRPVLQGPVHTQEITFGRDGAAVTLIVAHYRDQKQGSELVNAMNRLLDDDTPWRQVARNRVAVDLAGHAVGVRAATLTLGDERLRVWHWYWVDGRPEASDVRAKLSLAADRLLMRTDTSAWIAVATRADTDAAGDRALAAFARDMGPALRDALDRTAAR